MKAARSKNSAEKGKLTSLSASKALKEYRAKRDFSRTGEPRGGTVAARLGSGTGFYAIQKHKARRLHYDLRLELDGVLKSWAVTKGPSLDPAEKRLAVRTEDHPLEYGSFEGSIPEGEYGAGEVMLWDRGTWAPKGDPHEGLEKGELKFVLDGARLKGGFVLVRLRPRGKEKRENWLLIKERDGKARPGTDPGREWVKSVASGRTFDEIAAGGDEWDSKHGLKARGDRTRRGRKAGLPMPKFRAPQLATLAAKPPSGPGWLHEIKFDGYRIIAAVAGGKAKLYTRSGLDWTERFKSLSETIAQIPARSALIDGEAVVLDENGRSDFGRLQNALKSSQDEVRFYAFDLLERDGEDMAPLPLEERKARLSALLAEAPESVVYSDHIKGDGEKVLAECCRMGLEGIVSKRADRPYVSGRTVFWIKTKCTGRDEFVIGGWQPSDKKNRPFSSLLVGEFENGKLCYRGRVGTGFDTARLAELARRLQSLARKDSPFSDVPAAVARKARWAEPTLVAEIAYAERTRDGYLRQPSFIGLREDKPAGEVKSSKAMEAGETRSAIARGRSARSSVRLSHPDKIFFDAAGLTKADLAAHWRRVSDLALPHIVNRPLTLVRCPDGKPRGCFYQRHYARGMPKPLLPAPLPNSEEEIERYLKIEDAAGLEAAAQIGALEIHIWGARVDAIERPDRLVFDLDPGPGVSFGQLKKAAKDFHALLEAAGLKSFALLTGGKGIHIVAPLLPALDWEAIKTFAKGVAGQLAADDPARFTAKMTKSRREGRIYIDYLRNERSASAIAPYSPRAKETAPVAAPVTWGELSRIERADAYTMSNLPRRLSALHGHDPWEGYFRLEQTISQAALRMFG